MSGRRDSLAPAGWRPTHHSSVQVLDSATLHPRDLPVAGVWRCINAAPDGGWWCQPRDDAARWWLTHHGRRAGAASGMVNLHALRLVPSWVQLPLPGR